MWWWASLDIEVKWKVFCGIEPYHSTHVYVSIENNKKLLVQWERIRLFSYFHEVINSLWIKKEEKKKEYEN